MVTFDHLLMPAAERVRCAHGNVAADMAVMSPEWRCVSEEIADVRYSGWRNVEPRRSMLGANIALPIGCNATCPRICYEDVEKFHPGKNDLRGERLFHFLDDFRSLGGKVIRLVGVGEPTLSTDFIPLCRWAEQHRVAIETFTNGLMLSPALYVEAAGTTKGCENPARATYLGAFDHQGFLKAGTFVNEDRIMTAEVGLIFSLLTGLPLSTNRR